MDLQDPEFLSIVRAAARDLAPDLDPALPQYVETVLARRGEMRSSEAFMEPATGIALASLIVSVATLAWTVWRDLRQDARERKVELGRGEHTQEVIRRRVRLRLKVQGDPEAMDKVISTVTAAMLLKDRNQPPGE